MRRILVLAVAVVVGLNVFAGGLGELPRTFSANTSASAGAVNENFAAVENAIQDIREFVIEGRRTQVGLRGRVEALELAVLDPTPAPDVSSLTPTTSSLAQTSDDDEHAFVAGTLVDAAAVNARFERSRGELENIDAFLLLVQRDATSLEDRVATMEGLLAANASSVPRRTAIESVEALLPHVFEAATTMRSAHMNANFDALASIAAANQSNAAAIEAEHAALEPRIAALEAVTSASCADLHRGRSVRVFDIDVDPPSPVAVNYDERVIVTFGYVNAYVDLGYDGFRAWVVPYGDGEYAAGASFQGSSILTPEVGTLERYFSGSALDPGESTHVDEAVVSIVGVQLDDEGEQVNTVSLLRCTVAVDVTFSRPE